MDPEPELVSPILSGARHIACVGSYLWAVRGDGRVGCVYGDAGMIGHGGIRWAGTRWRPGVIPGVEGAIAVIEDSRTGAVQADGAVRCWQFEPYWRHAPDEIAVTTLAGI